MSSSKDTVDFILEQMQGAGNVSARKMFGEYGLFCNGIFFAEICDDSLFIKPTNGGRIYIGDVDEAPPHSGAKPFFHISGDRWDDADWLCGLVRVTVKELPLPKKK